MIFAFLESHGTGSFIREVLVLLVASTLIGLFAKTSGLTKTIMDLVRFKRRTRQNVLACGCSGDKSGCYLCGRCTDHCECPPFDEIGSPGTVPKP